ncbi:MAG TPA: Stp1/IreP family PP2C-type Ser/Thr phosphatase [Acidimicrobiia bacterium]|nr:Stp1/IreP family PP2C-type Ser/Thr phosphatase [Acidimicrobiia bacterium]
MRIDAGASSDVGQLRSGNEDSFLVDDRISLYAVADGMGGHQGGEVASATALEALRAAVAGGDALDAAIVRANRSVYEKAGTDRALLGMGTTLTAIEILGESTFLIGHVGDSRAYRVRDGVLEQLTEDHSLVEELVREGRLTPAEAKVHPQRSIITRTIGVDPDVDVDLYTLDARTGDRIIICSDGLTTMLGDDEVSHVAQLDADPRLAADHLVDAANEAGGEDNITVVVIDVLDAPPAGAPDPEALAARSRARTPTPRTAPDVFISEPRRPKWRSVGGALMFVLPVLLIVGGGIGAVDWYAHHTYFVSFRGDRVVVYRGVPGGILGWKPTVETTTDLEKSKLTPDAVDQVNRSGKGSLERAQDFVANLESSTSTTTTTTTTVPHPTTTRRNPPTTAKGGQ